MRQTIKISVPVWGSFDDETSTAVVKLRRGQKLSHGAYERTEEGYSSSWVIWSFDGETVTREWGSDGSDCDGRLSRGGEDVWDCSTLNDYGFPEWADVESHQRDYSAEAMGY